MFKLAYIALVLMGFIDLQFMLGLPSWIYFMQPQTMLTEHLPTDTSAREPLWKSLRTVLNNAVLTWNARIQQQQPTKQMDLHPMVYFYIVSNHEALTSQEIIWLSEQTGPNGWNFKLSNTSNKHFQKQKKKSMSENCAGWDSKPSNSPFFLIKNFFYFVNPWLFHLNVWQNPLQKKNFIYLLFAVLGLGCFAWAFL